MGLFDFAKKLIRPAINFLPGGGHINSAIDLFSGGGGSQPGEGPLGSQMPGGQSLLDRLGGFLKGNAGNIAAGAVGVKGLVDARNATKKRDELMQQRLDIARGLVEDTAGIRGATNSALEARINRGVLPPPDLGGLVDHANPFRQNFGITQGPRQPEGIPTPSGGGGAQPPRRARPRETSNAVRN